MNRKREKGLKGQEVRGVEKSEDGNPRIIKKERKGILVLIYMRLT